MPKRDEHQTIRFGMPDSVPSFCEVMHRFQNRTVTNCMVTHLLQCLCLHLFLPLAALYYIITLIADCAMLHVFEHAKDTLAVSSKHCLLSIWSSPYVIASSSLVTTNGGDAILEFVSATSTMLLLKFKIQLLDFNINYSGPDFCWLNHHFNPWNFRC